jgi:hypothetical protein
MEIDKMNHRNNGSTAFLLALLFPAVLACLPLRVEAQDEAQMVRTLVIKDNRVFIDGRELEASKVPAGVEVKGLTLSYSFIGVDMPVVTLGSDLYAVRADHLQRLEPNDQKQVLSTSERRRRELDASNGWIVDFDRGQYYTFQGERLEAEEAVPRLLNEANALYLEDLQKQNKRLFARLSREQELERQAEILASVIRSADPSEDHSLQVEALTGMLEEIFELKQQNRRDEIAQFETELDDLKQRVESRQALKDEIIERRLNRLTGGKK